MAAKLPAQGMEIWWLKQKERNHREFFKENNVTYYFGNKHLS
jgi:hypothetical protein